MYVFVGPVQYDYLPFQYTPPTRLTYSIPYGQTGWRDAAGVWHQKYAPGLLELDGATAVYGGGRVWPLTDQQAADLTAGGFGAYIQAVPGPAVVDTSVTDDPAALVVG